MGSGRRKVRINEEEVRAKEQKRRNITHHLAPCSLPRGPERTYPRGVCKVGLLRCQQEAVLLLFLMPMLRLLVEMVAQTRAVMIKRVDFAKGARRGQEERGIRLVPSKGVCSSVDWGRIACKGSFCWLQGFKSVEEHKGVPLVAGQR